MKALFSLLAVLMFVSGPLMAEQADSSNGGRPAEAPDVQWLDLVAEPLLAAADEPGLSPAEGAADDPSVVAPGEIPWLIKHFDYSGDLWNRPALTGDWFGVRQTLMDNGLRFDAHMVQTFQRAIKGGRDYRLAYTGSIDIGMQLDTDKAGLWPGGLLVVRGEYRFGRAANADSGALMPVNTNALFPVPGQDDWALSELNYTQFLAPWIAVTFGKYSPRETNVFASDETSQFMNTAFVINPMAGTTVPLGFVGAGVLLRPTEWFNVMTLVLDSEGAPDTSGSGTLFHRGVTVFQMAEFTIKPFGLPGHQRIGWSWSDKVKLQFQQNPRAVLGAILTGDTSGLKFKGRDCAVIYDFDQYLYLVPGSTDRGIGIFGRLGIGDRDVNPMEAFYSFGIGGKGLIPSREDDTFGAGYYYIAMNDTLPRMIKNHVQDEQGVELYYNIAVTPWLHITPDIQIIEPARRAVSTTIIAGVRIKIDF